MTFVTDMQTLSLQLLQTESEGGFGEPILITRNNYVPSVTQVGNADITSTLSYNSVGVGRNYNSFELQNEEVQSDDILLYLALPNPYILPLVNDIVSFSVGILRVIKVGRVMINGEDILFKLQCRV
jgi:hypothetical protein